MPRAAPFGPGSKWAYQVIGTASTGRKEPFKAKEDRMFIRPSVKYKFRLFVDFSGSSREGGWRKK